MNQTVRIVWLDDEIDHKKDAENLSSSRDQLEVIFLRPEDFDDFMKEVVEGKTEIDLYLIDDRLFKKEKKRRMKARGFSYAASIREKFQEIPIYLFSAVRDVSGVFVDLAEAAKNLADRIIDLKDVLREGSDFLYYDALDYRKIREARRNDVSVLYELVKAPPLDQPRIELALPDDLKGGLSSIGGSTEFTSGNAIAFAKWVRRKLLELPGFLYDSLYAAIKLGVTQSFFIGKATTFDEAKYKGVFSKSSEDLWWNTELDRIVFDIAREEMSDEATTDVREILRSYYGLSNEDLPRCAFCNKLYPDTVGLNKYDPYEREPVHFTCSDPHPKKMRVLYFDEIRQFVPRG